MRRGFFQSALTVVLVLFLGVVACGTFVTIIYRIRYGFNLDYTEGLTVSNAFYFWRGMGLYRDIHEPPYLMTLYTPLYHLLLAPFSSEFSRALLAGRIISFSCFIAVAAMVFSAVRSRTGGVSIPAISCGFLVSSYVLYADVSLAQINLLGVSLSVLGVWLVSERGNKLLAFVAFLLAACTKQSLVSGVCAASIWIGVTERPSRGFRFFGFFCLALGLIFFGINGATGGQFFLHAVKYLQNPIILREVGVAYFHFFKQYIVLLAVSVLFLSWRRPGIWQLYFVVGLLIAVTAAKEGSGPIYFAEALVGLLVSSGHALAAVRKKRPGVYGVVLALLIVQATLLLPQCRRRLEEAERLSRVEEEIGELSELVASTPGPLLTESADLCLANGKDYLYQGPEPRLWNEGLKQYSPYKPRAVLRDIEEGRFSLIAEYLLYSRDRDMLKLMKRQYYLSDTSYPLPRRRRRYRVWLPRRKAD